MKPAPALFETRVAANGARIGLATLNAERSLNALSLEMAALLLAQLHAWQQDRTVACVVLQGAGDKAFCAGGDVVALYQWLSRADQLESQRDCEQYFSLEYTLDYLIHTYAKPILCWGHGIVMGGGLGMMVGASHRIVTEKSRIAMPEISIGLYPDVGGSWFLKRMPGRTGLYVGLTGAPLNAADALFANLADAYLASGDRQEVLDRLLTLEWGASDRDNHHRLSSLLRGFRDRRVPTESNLLRHLDLINEVTNYDSLEKIAAALAARGDSDPWLARNVQALQTGSPTSAKVILEIYRRAGHGSLREAFEMELGLTIQFTRHPDLREGVRALLIDRDGKPKWSPATWAEVSDRYVEEHFESPWPAEADWLRVWRAGLWASAPRNEKTQN